MNSRMKDICVLPTVVESRPLTAEQLWSMYESGTLTREQYHERICAALDRTYNHSSCGQICIVDMDTLTVSCVYEGSL